MLNYDEICEILKKYPEIFLISISPITFEGFLIIIENSKTFPKYCIKVKLIVPFFPSTRNMTVLFTKDCEFWTCDNFRKIVINSLNKSASVPAFLKHLKENLLQKIFQSDYHTHKLNQLSNTYDFMTNRIQELKDVLLKYSDLNVSSKYNLSRIKLTTSGISIVLQKIKGTSWKVVDSDIPSICYQSFDNSTSLRQICDLFKKQVDDLKSIWTQLEEIDTNCWIIDPLQPKPSILYRRIFLTSSLSIMITIDPLNLTQIPNIKFLGCESAVSECRNKISDGIQAWNSESSYLQNLLSLLDIYEFPQKPVNVINNHDEGLVQNEECCICFLKESENELLPNIHCNNKKCNKSYHLYCLKQWLEMSSDKPTVFNQIEGKCPNCESKISCEL